MGSRDSRRIAGLEMKVAVAARSEAVGAESEIGETMGNLPMEISDWGYSAREMRMEKPSAGIDGRSTLG